MMSSPSLRGHTPVLVAFDLVSRFVKDELFKL